MNTKTLMLVGAILMILSLFLPVATVSAVFLSRSINGYESDLIFSGIIGFILLLVGLFWNGTPSKRYSPIATVLAGIALFNVLALFVRATGLDTTETITTSMGLGLPVCGLGSLLSFVAGLTRIPVIPTPTTGVPTTNDITTQPRKPAK